MAKSTKGKGTDLAAAQQRVEKAKRSKAKKPPKTLERKALVADKQLLERQKIVTQKNEKNKKPLGRPSAYTPEIATIICERIALGQSLRSATKGEDVPSFQTVFSWLQKYPIFLEQYVRAKEIGADAMAEEILDIADDGTNDWMEINRGNYTSWVTNGEAMQRSKLRVDTRRWLMSKLQPKKYADFGGLGSEGGVVVLPMVYIPQEVGYTNLNRAQPIEGETNEPAPTGPPQSSQVPSPTTGPVVPGTTHSTDSFTQGQSSVVVPGQR